MKRRYKLILAVFGSIILFVLMFMWLTGNLSREAKIPPGTIEAGGKTVAGVKTMEVTAVTVPVEIEAVGTVSARESVAASSRIMAVVTKAAVDSGDTVKKGQTLFVLDSRDAEARVAAAREALAAAEATLEKISLDAGRIERLYEKQAATRQEYDQVRAALKTAQASVEAAKATTREAEVNLSYTRIDSPISGKVIERLAEPGDMTAPGRPLISIYNPSTLRLEVAAADHLRPKMKLGDTVDIVIDSIGSEFEGRIEEIVPASDVSSRSFLVRVSIPETDTVYPGMYGRIRLSVGSAEAILIPPEAVRRVGQLETVTVVEDGVAHTRAVKTGKTRPEGVEILSGLVPGELIVLP